MKSPFLIACVLSLIFCIPAGTAADSQQSLAADQTRVEVTVYNNNLGLIKDIRKIELPAGSGQLRFMDVAASIMPYTVKIRSLNGNDLLQILEQNYEYDLMKPDKLLDKYVGKKMKLMNWTEFGSKKEIVDATLLSNNDEPIFQIKNDIYVGYPGVKIFSEIPEDLMARPTLTWLFDNKKKMPHEIETSYLTENLNWRSDYVAVLNTTDTGLDLSGWVTLTNQSGTTYKNARLKLIAGQVNRIFAPAPRMMRAEFAMAAESKASPQFAEQAFFEYHIYDLNRPTTLKDKQEKQVKLLETGGIKATKELLAESDQFFAFIQRYVTGTKPKIPVQTFIRFKNSESNAMGMPLPAGIIRLYKMDAAGSLQFIGEDSIEHTPKDEEVRLKLGESFDVVAERLQTDYLQVSPKVHESAWEVTVKNHKREEVTIGVIEHLSGSWQVIQKSHDYKKLDAQRLRFDLKIQPDGEVKLTYRIRVTTGD